VQVEVLLSQVYTVLIVDAVIAGPEVTDLRIYKKYELMLTRRATASV